MSWLQQQPGYALQRPARKHFRRISVVVNDTDSQWQVDLVDMQSLSLCIYLLVLKYAWVFPLKSQKGSSLIEAVKKIFKQGRKPEKKTKQMPFKTSFQTFLKNENVQRNQISSG